jgi:hypothetical protein
VAERSLDHPEMPFIKGKDAVGVVTVRKYDDGGIGQPEA